MKKPTLLLSIILLLTGCATIIHGPRQRVGVSSTPEGASLYVDGQLMGKTPRIVMLPRKDFHQLKIELQGYQPFEVYLIRKVDLWIAGNIVFGGIIGLVVDAVTGSMYKLTPDQVQAMLTTGKKDEGRYSKGEVFVSTVLKPEAGWQYIGHLTKNSQ